MLTEVSPKIEENIYQKNRNKPIPSLNHGYLQNKIGSRLDVKYEEQYNVFSELSLQLPSVKAAVPDLAIYTRFTKFESILKSQNRTQRRRERKISQSFAQLFL